MLKCHFSHKLDLFNKRFIFSDGPEGGPTGDDTSLNIHKPLPVAATPDRPMAPVTAPGAPASAGVPRPGATDVAPRDPNQPLAKPEGEAELISEKYDQMLPEGADLNKPLAEDTLGTVLSEIEAKVNEKGRAIAAYGKQPGADQEWAQAELRKLLEDSGAAKQKYKDRWERYKADLETKRQAALKGVIGALEGAADGNLAARERQVKVSGETYADFKRDNTEWLKEHDDKIMASVAKVGNNLYEAGELRKANQYDSEVGDNKLSNYQEGGGKYFSDVSSRHFEKDGDDDSTLEQYAQGLATAILAIYGKDAELKFGAACQKQEKEDVGFWTDAALYKHDTESAAAEVLEGADKSKAAAAMSELNLPADVKASKDFGNMYETKGFLYASLLAAQKELDQDLYPKYVEYLKGKIASIPVDTVKGPNDSIASKNLAFDYRQVMNPKTFKDTYINAVADEMKENTAEDANFIESNSVFLADAKGKIEAAKDLWMNGSAAIEGMSRPDLPTIAGISEIEPILANIEGNPKVLANVDLATHESSMHLVERAGQLEGQVLAQLEAKFNEKREAAKVQLQTVPGFATIMEMENNPNHPALGQIKNDPAQKYIFDNLVTAWQDVAGAKFTAKNVVEIQAAMEKITRGADSVTKAVAALAPVLIQPETSKLKQYAGTRRGVELPDLMDALDVTDKGEKYYSAFASLQQGDGHVKILVNKDGKWTPLTFQKGENIFAQMKRMDLKDAQIAIDTSGINQAVSKYGKNWQDLRKQYRGEYASTFHKAKLTTAVAKEEEAPKAEPAVVVAGTDEKTGRISRRGLEDTPPAKEGNVAKTQWASGELDSDM